MRRAATEREVLGLGAIFALILAVLPGPSAAGGDACESESFAVPQVEAACKSGGRKAAKKLMKDVVKAQRKAKNAITCDSCHTDLDSFERTPNAVADLKKYLAEM